MIRAGKASDRAALVALDRIAWDLTSTPAALPLKGDWAGEVDPADLVVAELDGEVVGYVLIAPRTSLESSAHLGQIRGIAVDPARRGQGIGRALLEGTIAEARRRGWERILLNALRTNTPALALYRAAGFRVVGHVRDHFRIGGAKVDDYVLELALLTEDRPPEWLDGGCHCGAVRFRVWVQRWELIDCSCSICTRKGILHLIVGDSELEWTQGREGMTSYRFGTGVAEHLFCPICGIHPAYRPRSHPDGWDVNARCLDAVVRDGLEEWRIANFDGRNWEAEVGAIR